LALLFLNNVLTWKHLLIEKNFGQIWSSINANNFCPIQKMGKVGEMLIFDKFVQRGIINDLGSKFDEIEGTVAIL